MSVLENIEVALINSNYMDVNGTDEDSERMKRRRMVYPLYIILGIRLRVV